MSFINFQTRIKSLERILTIIGIWNNGNSWYILYSIFVTLIFNLHVVARTANVFFINSLEELSAAGLLVIAEIMTNIKLYFILVYQNEIRELFANANKDIFQPKNQKQDLKARGLFKIFDFLQISFRSMTTFLYVMWTLYPLLESGDNWRLPFPAWYPYDQTKFPYYEITYVHQILSYVVMSQIHIGVDFLVFYLLGVVIVEFEFLMDALRRSHTNHDLVQCIKHHQDILAFFKKLNNMLNIVVFCQFAYSGVSACFTLFRLTVISITSSEFKALASFQTVVLFQLLLYCWWGNEVMMKSEQVPQAAFESDWIHATQEYKSNLVFFLHRSQYSTVIYTIDFFQVTLDTFKLIMRHSYSFFAVLRHLKERDQNMAT